jgi:hypothetical protein
MTGDARVVQRLLLQPGGLGAEKEDITGFVGDVGEPGVRVGGEGEDAVATLVSEFRQSGVPVLVQGDGRQVVVVQSGPLQVFVVEVEAERPGEVQGSSRPGALTDGVAVFPGMTGWSKRTWQKGFTASLTVPTRPSVHR